MKPVDLLVTLLANSDIVLSIPFLKQEKITIDAEKNDIILLTLPPEPEPLTATQAMTIEPPTLSNKKQNPLIEKQRIQTSTTQKSTATCDPEQAKEWHDNAIKEFSEVFCDKPPALKDRRQPKDAPFHRIQLKDVKKVINRRMFALPEKYLNWMLDFLDYHMEMGHIRPSKSSVSARMWMIPKKG